MLLTILTTLTTASSGASSLTTACPYNYAASSKRLLEVLFTRQTHRTPPVLPALSTRLKRRFQQEKGTSMKTISRRRFMKKAGQAGIAAATTSALGRFGIAQG